jgi:hypothetical protein
MAICAQFARLAGLLLLIALLATGVAAAAIAAQAGRDETRSVDLVLVLAPALPPASLVERSLDLYRRGYALELLLIGPGGDLVRSRLIAQDVPAAALLAGPGGDGSLHLAAAVQSARQRGAQTLLVVSVPEAQLLGLKIVRDQGLRAYGVPVGEAAIDPIDLARASARYWRYVLLGE